VQCHLSNAEFSCDLAVRRPSEHKLLAHGPYTSLANTPGAAAAPTGNDTGKGICRMNPQDNRPFQISKLRAHHSSQTPRLW
jgi:hypothetical protein